MTEPTPREAITEVLASYCRGIDRRDRALVASCFTEAATDDHGTGPRLIDEFLDWCFQLLARYDTTFHLLGQSSFEFTDDMHCVVETYGEASHRTVGGPAHLNLTTGFRYVDNFTRRDNGSKVGSKNNGWKIERRVAITDWSRHVDDASWWPVPDSLLQGRPGPDDPSYRR